MKPAERRPESPQTHFDRLAREKGVGYCQRAYLAHLEPPECVIVEVWAAYRPSTRLQAAQALAVAWKGVRLAADRPEPRLLRVGAVSDHPGHLAG